jgi:hypothetical protein
MEFRAGICPGIHHRHLANLAPCQHGQVRTLTVFTHTSLLRMLCGLPLN